MRFNEFSIMEERSKSVEKRSEETSIVSYYALYLSIPIAFASFHVSLFVHMIEREGPFP